MFAGATKGVSDFDSRKPISWQMLPASQMLLVLRLSLLPPPPPLGSNTGQGRKTKTYNTQVWLNQGSYILTPDNITEEAYAQCCCHTSPRGGLQLVKESLQAVFGEPHHAVVHWQKTKLGRTRTRSHPQAPKIGRRSSKSRWKICHKSYNMTGVPCVSARVSVCLQPNSSFLHESRHKRVEQCTLWHDSRAHWRTEKLLSWKNFWNLFHSQQ